VGVTEGSPEDATSLESTAETPYVYAIGRVEPQFPNISIEREFAQVVGRASTSSQTDREAMYSVLSERANRYLARAMCWIFSVSGLETYLLKPRDPADFSQLIDAVRPRPDQNDIDLVVGLRGPIAGPEACNGLMLPYVYFDQLYSFGRSDLLDALPVASDLNDQEKDQFRVSANRLIDRMTQLSENAGSADEDRAINYLLVRYPAIYDRTAEAERNESTLTAVNVHLSPLANSRKIVDVVLTYTHRRTDVTEKYVVKVDVEDEFPHLASKISPYFDRT
jgi:hypothetical protein